MRPAGAVRCEHARRGARAAGGLRGAPPGEGALRESRRPPRREGEVSRGRGL